MGKIFIEGVGNINIEGDIPNEEEQKGLLDLVGGPDDAGDPFVSSDNIEPDEGPDAVTPGSGATAAERPLSERMADADQRALVPGPLNLMPKDLRANVRRNVEGMPTLLELTAEIGPAVAGTLIGATAGIPLGPPGIIAGGIIGGLTAETAAQEIGLTPRSDLNLALAATGPIVGPAAGTVVKGIKYLGGWTFTKGLSPLRHARALNIMGASVDEFRSLGAAFIARQTGLLSHESGKLFGILARVKIRVQPRQMAQTHQAIDDIIKQLGPTSEFTAVKQTIASLQKVKTTLNDPSGVLLETFVRTRSIVADIFDLARQGGVKRASGNRIFGAMSDDLDNLAGSVFRRGAQSRVAKAANKRFKLEASVREFEEAVEKVITRSSKGDAILNFGRLQKWLNDVTNPKLAGKFNKNFTKALEGVLPEIKERIAAMVKVTGVGGPAGPGNLVIRGQGAKSFRALFGSLFAFLGSGGSAVAAGLGGVAGAQAPEMLVAMFTTKWGAAFLEKAALAGKGEISIRSWQIAGEIALRSFLGDTEDQRQQELEQQGRVPLTAREAVRRIEVKEKRRSRPPRARGARKSSTP